MSTLSLYLEQVSLALSRTDLLCYIQYTVAGQQSCVELRQVEESALATFPVT